MSQASKQVVLTVITPSVEGPVYLGPLKLGLDPRDNLTQIKFGANTSWAYPQRYDTSPKGHSMYQIGGQVQRKGWTLAQGGSIDLLRVDCATGAIIVQKDGYLPSGVQPRYPDGVGLVWDEQPGGTGGVGTLQLFPGRMLPENQFGGWPVGMSTPEGDRVMRYNEADGVWAVSGVPLDPSYPIPSRAFGRRSDVGGTSHRVMTRDADGLRWLSINGRSNNDYRGDSNITAGTYTATDPRPMPQHNDPIGIYGGGGQVRVLYYDWATGALLGVSGEGAPHTVTLIASLPALSSADVAMTWFVDFQRYIAVFVFPSGLHLVDLSNGDVSFGGALPPGIGGFTASFHDPFNDLWIATGELAGSDSLHRWQPPALIATNSPIPQDQWVEGLVSSTYFDQTAGWQWQTSGGDWRDATGAFRGAAAYNGADGTAQAGLGLWTDIPITALVNYWLSPAGNIGLVLRKTGSDNQISGRANAISAQRPYLTVMTSAGTFNCACTQNSLATGGSAQPPPASFYPGNGHITLLRFDLRALSGTVQSATLHLYTDFFRGNAKLFIFRPATPTIREWGVSGTPQTGLALGFTKDAGISSHPDVLYSTNFTGNWSTGWLDTQSADHYVAYNDPELGTNALRFHFSAGTWRTPLIHQDELYFRLYVKWEKDCLIYGQGGKMPISWDLRNSGIDGLRGVSGNGTTGSWGIKAPLEMGLYKSYTVDVLANRVTMISGVVGGPPLENDQIKFIFQIPPPGITEGIIYRIRNVSGLSFQIADNTTGEIIQLTAPQPGVVDPNGAWYLFGRNRSCIYFFTRRAEELVWFGCSMRQGYPSAVPRSPFDPFIRTGHYVYPADGGAGSGQSRLWTGGALGGRGMFRRDKWYCIEAYGKCNTLSGTPDIYGNQYANKDGIIRHWVDGVLEDEHMDYLLRHHPNMRLNCPWLEFVHGGLQRQMMHHHMRIANLVIARSYVGAMG